MAMQIRRTITLDNPPTGLDEGQLAVEMASNPAKLWVGVPTSIDPSGRRMISGLEAAPVDGLTYARSNADWSIMGREVFSINQAGDWVHTISSVWYAWNGVSMRLTTPTLNINGEWNTDGRYTPKVPGLYYFIARAPRIISYLALQKNDLGTFSQGHSYAHFGPHISLGSWEKTIQTVLHMNGTTDYVRLWTLALATGNVPTFPWPIMQAFLLTEGKP